MGSAPVEPRVSRKEAGASHAFWMVLCCLVPLALIVVLAYSGVSLEGFGLLAVLLLCPLVHFFMMRRGHHGRGG